MWVQEIEFDVSQEPAVCLSEGGFQNAGDVTVAELRVAAEAEFGKFVGDVTDPNNGNVPIGWKFRSSARYENAEVGGEFELETWVVLHDAPPEMKFKYHTILGDELAGVDQLMGALFNPDAVGAPGADSKD